MRIAFQGEIGAYSEAAVQALFPDAEPVATPSFEAVFDAVENGEVPRGVVPIENSLHGSVHANYDLLRTRPVRIVGELHLRIRHCLMALASNTIDSIERVYSHPQALGQCRDFLQQRLAHAEAVPAYDTAGAARMVASMPWQHAAAVASRRAAEEYGLAILAESIESNHQNYTRFFVLAPQEAEVPPIPDEHEAKTSLVFSPAQNVPGALSHSLAVFAERDLDLFKIESHPLIGSPGQYIFYLDVEHTPQHEQLAEALERLNQNASFVKVLGAYTAGETIE